MPDEIEAKPEAVTPIEQIAEMERIVDDARDTVQTLGGYVLLPNHTACLLWKAGYGNRVPLERELATLRASLERARADERERLARVEDAAERFLTDPHAYILHGPAGLVRTIFTALRAEKGQTP